MRYVEIWPDGPAFVIRFYKIRNQGKILMHAIYCVAIAHSDLIHDWITTGMIP